MTRRSRKNASDKSDAHKDPEGREDLERILTSIPVDRMLRFFFFFFLNSWLLHAFVLMNIQGEKKFVRTTVGSERRTIRR